MKNRKILVIDDNLDIHTDFKKILLPKIAPKNENFDELSKQLFSTSPLPVPQVPENDDNPIYTIDSAYQGEEGFQKVKAANDMGQPYALVFVDVRMPPGRDGIKTAEDILAEVPETEIVICSAYSDYPWKEFNRRFGNAENLGFLRKPFDAVEIQQLAITLTGKWNSARQIKMDLQALETSIANSRRLVKEQQVKMDYMEKIAALGTMCGGVAHEINTPLTAILMSAGMLQDLISKGNPNDQSKIKDLCANIVKTSNSIAKVVRAMLTYATHTAQDADKGVVDIKRVLEDTLNLCENRYKSAGIELISQAGDQLEIEGKSIEIVQVLLNLLNNSFDAVLTSEVKSVKIEAQRRSEYVEISVTDSGPGIPEPVRSKIFDPFFTTKGVGSGTGLGLSVCKGIVTAHFGSIFLDTQSPNTKFVIRLPILDR